MKMFTDEQIFELVLEAVSAGWNMSSEGDNAESSSYPPEQHKEFIKKTAAELIERLLR